MSELGSKAFNKSVKLRRTLAEACAQELIAIRTDTGELAMLIYTLILAQVTGVAALVYVCRQRRNLISCFSCKLPKYFSQICVFILVYVCSQLTIAGKAIRPQLITLLTSTQERPVRVITPLTAGGPHATLINI